MPMLKTFDTLEQAMVTLQTFVQAGRQCDRDGKKLPGISPARYDFGPIANITEQISKRVPLTDRQQELVIKLVTKYHKQWKKLGYDASNINLDTPVELKIRTKVDRSQTVSVKGNKITLKFPYKPRLINIISEYAQMSCGEIARNKEDNVWEVTATAGNIAWLDKFVNDHKFVKDAAYKDLVKIIDKAYDYKSIELDIVDDKLVLHNAPETMLKWIRDNIGEIIMKNFIRIVSSANILAFTLSEAIVQYTVDNYPDISDIILMRRTFVSSDSTTMDELLEKVNQLQYHSIVLFVADQSIVSVYTHSIKRCMPGYDILTCSDDMHPFASSNKSVVITHRVMARPADLIISLAGFMAGHARKNWFNSATKNIYYCQDIDNKIKKQLKKDESNINYKR